ncbi:MAG: DoxX family protein [Lepagella sp.]|jgi:hypothetical protein
MSLGEFFKKLYFWGSGYSYTNLGRLFLRLFVGLMLLQFGVRQILDFEAERLLFPSVMGMSPSAGCIVMVCIEIGCSVFIMCGFLTRLMIIPPFIAMLFAEYYILHNISPEAPYMLQWDQIGYLPIMFLGIYFFLMLVGPGKISVDYFLSLHIIHTDNKSERELEEV